MRGPALLVLVACTALPAAAQGARRVIVQGPSCPPAWYEEGAFIDALRVELAGHDVAVERTEIDGEEGIRLRLARSDCDDDGTTLTVAIDDDMQAVSLVDLAPGARLRTLAIATSDRLLTTPAPAPQTVAEPPAPRPVAHPALGLDAPTRRAPPSVVRERPTPLELRVGVGAQITATASSLDAFGGGSVALELGFGAVPLFARAAVIVLAGGAGHAFGQLDALLVGGTAGVGVDLRVEIVRVSPRLDVGVVHAELDAVAARGDVTVRDEARALVWIEPAVHLGLDVDRFWIGAQLGVPIVLRGVQATAVDGGAPAEPVLTIEGALLHAELALGARFELSP